MQAKTIAGLSNSFNLMQDHTNQQWILYGLNVNNISVRSIDGTEYLLDSIISQGDLVLYLHESFCFECVREIVDEIKKSEYVSKVAIIGCYESLTTLQMLAEGSILSERTYNTEFRTLNKEFDTIQSPVFFFVNEEMMTERVYIPIKGLPSLINNYFYFNFDK
jgi:hypothetical protein